MALIKCSECGNSVSEKASVCPKCGCPINIIIKTKKEKNKRKRLKILLISVVLFVMLCGLGAIIVYSNTPIAVAKKLIKKEFDGKVVIENLYYNSEINGCIVKFSVDGKKDTATIHLDEKTIGYESVLSEYNIKAEGAVTDEEKKKYAKQYIDYVELYDITWEINMLLHGSEESGWEQIK